VMWKIATGTLGLQPCVTACFHITEYVLRW
jgi:hypothetical protein